MSVVVHRRTRRIVAEHELGGQPDSLALAPDRKRLAIVIVIENERDEDLNDDLLPQSPSGQLLIVDLQGPARWWTIREADLSPVAESAFAGADLEPEFVDINTQNEAVVTFQENNHLAIVDMKSGKTINHFPAGSALLSNVDTREEDLIALDTNLNKRREPDSVAWIDEDSFATANEGDYEDAAGEQGGSRGFTIFNQNGDIEYESAESFEHLLVSAGHYNEGRSENKAVEPESIEFGKFNGQPLLFVGSERSNAIGVYDVGGSTPRLVQVLPTGIGPEGLKSIPARGLLVASTEKDEAGDGIPTMINIYAQRRKQSPYPQIVSANDSNELPIPWVALSGLAGDPWSANTLYAVSDSFLAEGFIYTIDVSQRPALITDRMQVTGASGAMDLEGIEGIAVTGEIGSEVVYVAIQRAWPDEGDTDQVNTKIGGYDVATSEWGFVHYPLEAQGNSGWIGLSELTLLPNGDFAVIERDKGWDPSTAPNAELKALYTVDLEEADFRAYDNTDGLVTVTKQLLLDVLPGIERRSIWTAEKLEGFLSRQMVARLLLPTTMVLMTQPEKQSFCA